MANKHCYMHNAVVSRDMDGEIGHVYACEVGPRFQHRKRDKYSHKGCLKAAGGPTNIEFGGFIPDKEAYALIKRRPGSEIKMRELSGNHIFKGPYPLKEDCGGVGSNMLGRCPPRPCSSSKAIELKGNDIFAAFSNPYYPPAPPPLCHYEPEEIPLPPNKLRRNPTKMSSHFNLGGPVCIDPRMPSSKSGWAKQKMLFGSMDELDKDMYPKPVVSAMKARELAGHVNLFGTPPNFSLPSTPAPERCDVVYCGGVDDLAEKARLVHKIKVKGLVGHNAVIIDSDSICAPKKPKQVSHAKALEMKGNDIFASVKPDPRRCYKPSRASSGPFSGGTNSFSSKCDFPHK